MQYVVAVVGILVSVSIGSWLRARPARQNAGFHRRETDQLRALRRELRSLERACTARQPHRRERATLPPGECT